MRRVGSSELLKASLHEAFQLFVYPTLDDRVRPTLPDESDTVLKVEQAPCSDGLNEHRMTDLQLEHQMAYAIIVQGIDYAGNVGCRVGSAESQPGDRASRGRTYLGWRPLASAVRLG